MQQNKTMLIILDGWGIGDKTKSDAISRANTPFMDSLLKKYPHSQLSASGKDVGLPEGQMGNSEVGHMNIGAGRVVYQNSVKITKSIEDGDFFENEKLVNAFQYAKDNNKSVHFMGLVSDGGVHSLPGHLYALCDMAKQFGLDKVFIHALTDGRDTDPRSGIGYMKNLLAHLDHSTGQIASIAGRYYTMDRDKRWERVKEGYDLMLKGKGKPATDMIHAMQESYDEGVTDEFIKPIIHVDGQGKPIGTIQKDDVVICFNFRTDRLRQITTALTQQDFPDFGMKTMPLYYLTMTEYDNSFKHIHVIFEKTDISDSMGEVLAKAGKKQLRIAETEKYAHVTFFFSGGKEEEYANENRILIPSPKVATYDLQPEMSAYKVKDAVVEEINKAEYDFICLNFANGDMVGHTGINDAILKAIETVDKCVKEVIQAAIARDYISLIIADHGNSDFSANKDGSPNTAHSTNPVPCILVSEKYDKINDGVLADVAPTLLKIMGLEIPDAMEGKALI